MERQLMRGGVKTALSLAALAACVLAVGFSAASFTDTEQNPQTITAAADWIAPTASASAIAKTEGGASGYIKAGGTYRVYANVADSGGPASGIASVKADVSSITTGQTAVSLVAGTYSANGVSYNYRSAELTAKSSLTTGSKNYSLVPADSAGNSRSQTFSVMVLGALKGSDFDTDNASGGVEGQPEKGDTVSFTFNNDPEPSTIASGWTGATTSVTVSIVDGGKEDSLAIGGGVAIGGVALKGDFTDSTATFSGSAMSLGGSTVTVVLGTASGSVKAVSVKVKPVWTPVESVFDLAWNACSTTAVTGANQKQF
jgi:hypothetical protein